MEAIPDGVLVLKLQSLFRYVRSQVTFHKQMEALPHGVLGVKIGESIF